MAALAKRPPQVGEEQMADQSQSSLPNAGTQKESESGFRRKYDFADFSQTEEQEESGGFTQDLHSTADLERCAEEVLEGLKSMDLKKVNNLLNNLENSAYRWTHTTGAAAAHPLFSAVGADPFSQNGTFAGPAPRDSGAPGRKVEAVRGREQDHDYDRRLGETLSKRGVKNMDQFVEEEYESMHPELEQGKKEGKAYLKKVVTRQSATARKEERVLSSCRFCLANGLLKEEEVLSISDNFFLIQPNKSSRF